MTNRPSSTFWSNIIAFHQSNGLLQAWSLLSLMLVSVAEANSNRFCDNKPDGSFDFFYFVQQWPGAFCSRGCCFARNLPLPAAQFGIHGLWPSHFGGLSPCYCPDSSGHNGRRKMDRELERKLQQHWVSMQCPNNFPGSLYMHGWKKHGTCSGMNQAYYFHIAIRLHLKYNLLLALSNEGIDPDGRLYDLADMQEALGRFIGEDSIITCSMNQQRHVSQIYEVYICLDKWKLLPFQCPDNPILQTNCRRSNVLFPEFDPRTTSPSPPSTPSRFHPPIRYCAYPSFHQELAIPSSDDEDEEDEESLELYLDSVDLELGVDDDEDDEFEDFLGNTAVAELGADEGIINPQQQEGQ